jgi:hypothetical protein
MADNNIKIITNRDDIVAIADAVRNKTGQTNEMTLREIVSGINGISGGDGYDELNSLITRDFTEDYYTNDRATTIGAGAFCGATHLRSVNFPNCTKIFGISSSYIFNQVQYYCGIGAFAYCFNLTTVSFPAATRIGNYAFAYCFNLTTVSFPAATHIDVSAFAYCFNLTTVSFPAATRIDNYAFATCEKLKSLYLPGSSVCELAATSTFSHTPIATSRFIGTYGSIYVPASLVAAYKSATNWAVYASRITAM